MRFSSGVICSPTPWTAPGIPTAAGTGFIESYLVPLATDLRDTLGSAAPRLFLILGNDDPFWAEEDLLAAQERGLWTYLHRRSADWAGFTVYGYNCVPPTPFQLKDWERYDVSRYVGPGLHFAGRRRAHGRSDAAGDSLDDHQGGPGRPVRR